MIRNATPGAITLWAPITQRTILRAVGRLYLVSMNGLDHGDAPPE